MNAKVISLLALIIISSTLTAQKIPITKISDSKVRYRQLINKSTLTQREENEACTLLEFLRPLDPDWVDNEIRSLGQKGKALPCLPARRTAMRIPEETKEKSAAKPTPTPKPERIPEKAVSPISTPSAPALEPEHEKRKIEIIQKREAGAQPIPAPQQLDVAIADIMNRINNIITKNNFKPREQWPHADQETVNLLIKKAEADQHLTELIAAYFKDLETVKKRAQLALQIEQAVNFLYIHPVNDDAVKDRIANIEKLGAQSSAAALKKWIEKPLYEEQHEAREREIRDILDVSKILANEPHELWLEKIKMEQLPDRKEELEKLNAIRENFILEVGHEKEPDSFATLLKNLDALKIRSADKEAQELRDEIAQQLALATHIDDQEAINRLVDAIITEENRALGSTLVRILNEAENNDERYKEQQELINLVREHGSSKAFLKLQQFVKENDAAQSKLKWPSRLPFEFTEEQKHIKRK